MDRVY